MRNVFLLNFKMESVTQVFSFVHTSVLCKNANGLSCERVCFSFVMRMDDWRTHYVFYIHVIMAICRCFFSTKQGRQNQKNIPIPHSPLKKTNKQQQQQKNRPLEPDEVIFVNWLNVWEVRKPFVWLSNRIR